MPSHVSGQAQSSSRTFPIISSQLFSAIVKAPAMVGGGGTNTLPTSGVNDSWWEASSLIGTLADGAVVTSLADGSGNGRTMTPPTTGPIFKTNIVNGRPVLRFAGTNTPLRTAWATKTPDAMTYSVVAKHAVVSGAPQFLLGTTASYPGGWNFGAEGFHLPRWGLLANTGVVVESAEAPATNPPDTSWRVYTGTYDGVNTARLYLDGTLIATNSAVSGLVNDGTVADFFIGTFGSDYFNGDIAFAARYGRLLTNAERAQLHSRQQDFYNITVSDYTPVEPSDIPVTASDSSTFDDPVVSLLITDVAADGVMTEQPTNIVVTSTVTPQTGTDTATQSEGVSTVLGAAPTTDVSTQVETLSILGLPGATDTGVTAELTSNSAGVTSVDAANTAEITLGTVSPTAADTQAQTEGIVTAAPVTIATDAQSQTEAPVVGFIIITATDPSTQADSGAMAVTGNIVAGIDNTTLNELRTLVFSSARVDSITLGEATGIFVLYASIDAASQTEGAAFAGALSGAPNVKLWNGTTELSVTLSIWNGAMEIPTTWTVFTG